MGQRIVRRGYSDAAKGDIFGDFDEWADHSFWPALTKSRGELPTGGNDGVPKLVMEMKPGARASQLRQDVREAIVTDARLQTAPGEPEKHHLKVMLPSDMAYEPGDYLAVLPLNPDTKCPTCHDQVSYPLGRDSDGESTWRDDLSNRHAHIHHIPPQGLRRASPPSHQKGTRSIPFSKKSNRPLMKPNQDIRKLASSADDTSTQAALLSLAEQDYDATILSKRTSILDLLTHYSNISLPFPDLLSILPAKRPRHYSISSPLANPGHCSIIYSLIDSPTSLSNSGPFHGVIGSYLASLRPNETLQVSIRPSSNKNFRLPPRKIPNPSPHVLHGHRPRALPLLRPAPRGTPQSQREHLPSPRNPLHRLPLHH